MHELLSEDCLNRPKSFLKRIEIDLLLLLLLASVFPFFFL
jgi:hypothetical protein